jgi:hypothetical protein
MQPSELHMHPIFVFFTVFILKKIQGCGGEERDVPTTKKKQNEL